MPGASHIIGNLSTRHRALDSATSSATSTARPSRAWRSHVICDNLFHSHQAAWRRATNARRRRPAAECPLPVPACAEQLAHP